MINKFADAAVILFLIFTALVLGCTPQKQQELLKEDSFNYTAYFCHGQGCLQAFASQLKSAHATINCALYGIDGTLLSDLSAFRSPAAANITIEIVVDKNTKIPAAYLKPAGGFVLKRSSKGIMHDKYCILDNVRIITGSFNPTAAAKKDYNNILIINSTSLAAFYRSDFERLKFSSKGETPTAAAVASNKPKLKTAILNKTAVEAYFCPEDGCMEAVKRKLRTANSSILFAAYSFTSAEIANDLILKRSEGVAVAGVIEKFTTGSKYSKHNALAANGINVTLEGSKRLMHHKFFVIDNKTVITGSFNPTENADRRNDENIIIIENPEVAKEYSDEYYGIIETS